MPRSQSHAPGALSIAFVVVALSGCTSFRAVSAAGDLGLRVGTQQDALVSVYAVCLDSAAIGVDSAYECDQILPAEREVTAGMRAIAAYGAALKALADADDPDVEDNVSAAFEAMPEGLGDAPSPTAGLVASLTAFVTRSYHRGELREVVDQAHPTVVALCSRLEEVLELWKEMLVYTRETALWEMEHLPEESQRAQRLSLARVAARARVEQGRIEDAFRAVRAFNASHATLQRARDLNSAETFTAVVEAAFRFGAPVANPAPAEEAEDEAGPSPGVPASPAATPAVGTESGPEQDAHPEAADPESSQPPEQD